MDTQRQYPLVYLLREPASPDAYETVLQAQGFRVRSIPVLSFRFTNADDLRSALAHPERFGGLILTSPRAVESIRRAVGGDTGLLYRWTKKPAYVVGPATAGGATGLGLRAVGAEAGDAEALARLIIGERSRLPLLFPCGNRSREVLPDQLNRANVPFERLVTYETMLSPDLSFPPGERPDWIVFFSPSGVEAFRQASPYDPGEIRFAAIGSTTELAVKEVGWAPRAVAAQPNPSALAHALASANND